MIKQILVATDGSENSLTAADYAINLARLFNATIRGLFVKDVKILTGPLIHDIGTSIGGMVPYGTFNQTIRELLESQADAALNQVEGKCAQAKVTFTREIREGIVSREIIKSADDCDLIAMGKMGAHAEWRDVFLGTNVEYVVRQTHKPVLITPSEYKPFRKMLIAYDGSSFADKALRSGAEIAQAMKLPITVVCVADKKDEALQTLSKAKTFLEGYKLAVDAVAKGESDHAVGILEVCNDEDSKFDILVMGAYGHSRLQEMILGSTTVRVMRSTNCSILLCR
ncbi:MAG: universal stress protein [Planctomycetes bacterium]|uniref:universal stress protein n=1 Tax=Candidatus Wunengus californicus TaxID=3367619 RepID=UPI004027F178|nr:universal stress protein [Planctomycetota bacterium]MBI4222651.1 universal stress protein [Planctomycetota bacterium]